MFCLSRPPTLRSCKYNVNQATNVTMRHDLSSLPDCGRNMSVPRTHVLGYSRPSPGDFSLSLEHNPRTGVLGYFRPELSKLARWSFLQR